MEEVRECVERERVYGGSVVEGGVPYSGVFRNFDWILNKVSMKNFISNGCEKLWEVEEEVKRENNGHRLWDVGEMELNVCY